jgi:hypothetical protein
MPLRDNECPEGARRKAWFVMIEYFAQATIARLDPVVTACLDAQAVSYRREPYPERGAPGFVRYWLSTAQGASLGMLIISDHSGRGVIFDAQPAIQSIDELRGSPEHSYDLTNVRALIEAKRQAQDAIIRSVLDALHAVM